MAEIDDASATMEKKLVKVSGATLGSAVAAAASPGEALFRRRIEFHPARKAGMEIDGGSDFQIETLNPSTDTRIPVVGVGAGKAPTTVAQAGMVGEKGPKISDEHGMDPEFSFNITFRRIGAGLANLGNTCFLNSVLQCLTYTEPFAAYLQSGKHKSSCRTPGFCALCALQNHVMSALQSSGKILTPYHLVKNLRSISRNFQNARQEDAHEYMVNLLESMHKCCIPSGVPSESPGAYEKSLVHKIFGGLLRSQVKCTQCSYSSNKFDPFLDLSLEITKGDSLCKALSHFTAVEYLDGGEKQYQCQRCKQKVRALKQLTVHKAPYVLTIHLKRFGSVIPGQKIDKKVNFDPTLDLKPFVSDQRGNLKYTLYGVLVHAGWSTHSGHYYCYVRTSSGMWHFLNDNQVSQVSEKVVLAQKAYMLFYIRNRNSASKRPVDACGKENGFTHTSRDKLLDVSQGLKEKTENNSLDGNWCTSQWSSAVSKVDALCSDENLHTNVSSLDAVKMKQGSSFPINDLSLPKAARLLQSNGHADKKFDVSLGFPSSDVSLPDSKGQHIAETSTESDSSSKENNCQMLVKKLVISLSNANKGNAELRQSAPSNANVIGKGAIASGTQQNQYNGLQDHVCKGPPKNEVDGASSKEINELINPHEVCEQQGSKSSDIAERFQRDQMGLTVDKFIQKKDVDSCGQSTIFKHGPWKEVLADTRRDHTNIANNIPAAVSKKRVKHSRNKGMYFGRRHLLFASLSLRKKRKLKRSRKKLSYDKTLSKPEVFGTFVTGNQETSTSKMVNMICMEKKSTAKNQFHSHSTKEGKHHSARDNLSYNASEIRFIRTSSVDHDFLANSKSTEGTLMENTSHPSPRDVDTLVKSSVQSTLMRGLEEAYVPKWDDYESHSSIDEIRSTEARSIGYVLDEWDEEYDRGKRRKVKKSRQNFPGINPFEEIAMRNRRQKMKLKLDQSSSANQPFRI